MAEESEQKSGRPVSGATRAKFWVGVVVVVTAVVVGTVVSLRASGDAREELQEQLNARYVEKIEVTSKPRGSGYTEQIVIDGVARDDCEAEDGRLICADDPQPTEE